MQIVKWDEICSQIEKANDWDEIKKMSDQVAAFKVWAQQTKQSLETQNIIAEYRLRLERKKGTWLSSNELHKGAAQAGWKNEVPESNHVHKLSDLNITKKESYIAQQIASIPEETFEEFIQEKKEAVNNAVAELTTTGAVRLAKSLQEKKEDLKVMQGLSERLEIEKELKEIAHNININYTKEQRIFLVKFIKQ